MMTFKNRACQIIELPAAGLTHIALTRGVLCVKPALGAVGGITPRTPHAIGPAYLANHFKALGIINQVLYVDHGWDTRIGGFVPLILTDLQTP
jgi:hypothetical protein